MRDEIKKTKITLRSDKATGLSYEGAGAHINGIAFNLDLIGKRSPAIATKLMELFDMTRFYHDNDTPKKPLDKIMNRSEWQPPLDNLTAKKKEKS